MLVAGIDEAGRGPVLGPLVIAGVLVHKNHFKKLKKLGVKDSKLLSKQKREELFEKIIQISDKYKIISIAAYDIDSALISFKNNLNILEAHTSAEIISHLNPEKVILDLPDRNRDRYCSYIIEKLKEKVEITAEHKADLNYPVVSAASILAKVTRDKQIDDFKKKLGIDCGSGYMTDPKTQKFLDEHWNNKKITFFRKEWSSWKKVKIKKTQKRIFEF
ncbi:ribonuclease HII [Candidatus Woesearchaeota archaeon]|nr:ribonuclease HII [Candidatus Woesearchaeota archaeon]